MNIHVSKWDSGTTDQCAMCHNEKETTIHLFCKCQIVRNKIWKPLKNWLKYMHKVNVKFSNKVILLNDYKGPFAEAVNMYILIAKFYIYRAKVQQLPLSFVNYISDVNDTKRIEKTIARITNKTLKFEIKWL